MQFVEDIEVPVTKHEAWQFLWEIERLAGCLPGCTGVDEREPQHTYRARFQDRIGPYQVAFELDVEIVEIEPGERIRLRASGRDKRLGVSQQVSLAASLQDIDADRTAIHVDADIEVIGKIATLGQFAIKRKAKDVVAKFAENVAKELSGVSYERSAISSQR